MAAHPRILEIEQATLNAWPAIKSVFDGAWAWRFAEGYTKRANSVQSLDEGDDGDARMRIARMVGLFERHGTDPVFRVTPLAGPGVIAALDEANWTVYEESRVLVRPLADTLVKPAGDIRLFAPTDPQWCEAHARMAGYTLASAASLKKLLALLPCEARGVLAYGPAGEAVFAALAINALGIGVYNNVVTDPDHRGKGYARAGMAAALAWTQEAGAHSAAIQVVADNTAAGNLYASLGFEELYRYHYRSPIQESS